MERRECAVEGVGRLKIAVLGLGFVGLTAALGFADKGFRVQGYDVNNERVTIINSGKIPFLEPGLDSALERTLGRTFSAASHISADIRDAGCIFFCVGTPCAEDGKVDLSQLFSAIDSVVGFVNPNCLFVVKSTIPPGTTGDFVLPYIRSKGFNGSLAVNPEFLREGHCWDDFINSDRIVCGCDEADTRAVQILSEIYAPFGSPVHFVSYNTAEFIKYLSNSLLAAMISFSNEMALLTEAVGGINVAKAFKILHEDKRLADSGISHYIYPGCGYGGYCLPKDTAALAAHAQGIGFTPHILNNVISLNENMPRLTAEKIMALAGSKDEKIGILGLSFKPGSDDVRDSSAAKIIGCLIDEGYKNIYAYDPAAVDAFQKEYGYDVTYTDNMDVMCKECGTIALVTAWEEFKEINKKYLEKKICDCRYYTES